MTEEGPAGLLSIIWLRPEFEDRWEKLINLAEAATRARVTRAAISNWRKRHPDFPAPVVEQRDNQNKALRVWISTEEFDAWRATPRQKKKAQSSRSSPVRKLTQQLATNNKRLDTARAVVADLESEHAAIQDALRKALAAAEADTTAARQALD